MKKLKKELVKFKNIWKKNSLIKEEITTSQRDMQKFRIFLE